jgi:hypothetical protein
MIPVFITGIICALMATLITCSIELKDRHVYAAVLVAFYGFPMYWVYRAQTTEPLPNIPVVGTIDSWSEPTKLVRVGPVLADPQWQG